MCIRDRRITTWNVNDLQNTKAELNYITQDLNPDILLIQETRLHRKQHNSKWVKMIVPGYHIECSSRQETEGSRRGGIAVLIKEHIWDTGIIKITSTKELEGYLQTLTLQGDCQGKLLIHNTYIPPYDTRPQLKFRDNIYKHIQEMGKAENTITIVAGDLNAVADESYRESKRMHPRDFKHQEYMEDNNMVSLYQYMHTTLQDGHMWDTTTYPNEAKLTISSPTTQPL